MAISYKKDVLVYTPDALTEQFDTSMDRVFGVRFFNLTHIKTGIVIVLKPDLTGWSGDIALSNIIKKEHEKIEYCIKRTFTCFGNDAPVCIRMALTELSDQEVRDTLLPAFEYIANYAAKRVEQNKLK